MQIALGMDNQIAPSRHLYGHYGEIMQGIKAYKYAWPSSYPHLALPQLQFPCGT